MNTPTNNTVSTPDCEYPQQPVHVTLVDRLYIEAESLERAARFQSHLELPDTLGSRLIAATLRSLDNQGVCLKPASREELAALARHAVYLLRRYWRFTIRRDFARAKGKEQRAALVPIEVLVGDAWQPATALYGNRCSWRSDTHASRLPGDDLLAGETGRCLLELLRTEYGLSRERALIVLLSCVLPRFPRVLETLQEMGFEDISPTYLRKWAGKEVPHILKQLRHSLREWGFGQEDAPEQSSKPVRAQKRVSISPAAGHTENGRSEREHGSLNPVSSSRKEGCPMGS